MRVKTSVNSVNPYREGVEGRSGKYSSPLMQDDRKRVDRDSSPESMDYSEERGVAYTSAPASGLEGGRYASVELGSSSPSPSPTWEGLHRRPTGQGLGQGLGSAGPLSDHRAGGGAGVGLGLGIGNNNSRDKGMDRNPYLMTNPNPLYRSEKDKGQGQGQGQKDNNPNPLRQQRNEFAEKAKTAGQEAWEQSKIAGG